MIRIGHEDGWQEEAQRYLQSNIEDYDLTLSIE